VTQFDPGTGHLLGLGCEAYLACEALPHALSSRVCLIALCVSSRSESVPPGDPKKGVKQGAPVYRQVGLCTRGSPVHMWQYQPAPYGIVPAPCSAAGMASC
jgi:hypothetical protein